MGKFTKISQDAFDELQLDAGVLLNAFDPSNPVEPSDSQIIAATTGGVNPSCVPQFSDFGEDIDNVPNSMMELKHLDGWECKLSTTILGTSVEAIQLALGAADIDPTTHKVAPRRDLKTTDFKTLWWVGDRADGGLVAIKLINALSTGGFSLQTTKNGKGTIAIELTGHVSINQQTVMPMEFYSESSEESTVTYIYTAVSPVGTENPAEEGWYVLVGDNYFPTNDTEVDSNVTYYERTEAN